MIEPAATAPTSRNRKKKENTIPSDPQSSDQSDYDAHFDTQGGVNKEFSTCHQEGSDYDANSQNISNITSHEGESRKPSNNGKRRGANRDSITMGGL